MEQKAIKLLQCICLEIELYVMKYKFYVLYQSQQNITSVAMPYTDTGNEFEIMYSMVSDRIPKSFWSKPVQTSKLKL